MFGLFELLFIPLNLLLTKRSELLCAAVADEKRAENNIFNMSFFIVHGTIRKTSIQLSLVVKKGLLKKSH